MADIFISYDISDYSTIKKLATYFTNQGLTVWWDVKLKPNSSFSDKYKEEIENAAQVIVIWSNKSAASSRVLEEAKLAQAEYKLVSFKIGNATIPEGFDSDEISELKPDAADLSSVYDQLEQLPRVKIRDTSAARASAEARFWSDIVASEDVRDYELYLEEFPTGTFVDTVKAKLKELKDNGSKATTSSETKVSDDEAGMTEADGKVIDEMLDHYEQIGETVQGNASDEEIAKNIQMLLQKEVQDLQEQEEKIDNGNILDVSATTVKPDEVKNANVEEVKRVGAPSKQLPEKKLLQIPDGENLDKIVQTIEDDTKKISEETLKINNTDDGETSTDKEPLPSESDDEPGDPKIPEFMLSRPGEDKSDKVAQSAKAVSKKIDDKPVKENAEKETASLVKKEVPAESDFPDPEIPEFMMSRPNWESSLDSIKQRKQEEIDKKEAEKREKEIRLEAERLKKEDLKLQKQEELKKKEAEKKEKELQIKAERLRKEETKKQKEQEKLELKKKKEKEKQEREQQKLQKKLQEQKAKVEQTKPVQNLASEGIGLSYKSVENEVPDFSYHNSAAMNNSATKVRGGFPWLTLLALIISLGITALALTSFDITKAAKKVIADLDIEKRLKGPTPIKDCEYCPEMIIVPAGKFMMGAPVEQVANDQKPQREVSIAKSFAVGRFEIKFSEWDYCVKDGGCKKYKPRDEAWGRGEHPVINVSWNDAKTYIKWLSKKTNTQYRLLSEAEWEYAARAGTQTPFTWGNNISHRNANFDRHNSRTVPVHTYWPNGFSLYQMYGNVWEHVEDCWHGNYKNAPTDGSAWLKNNAGNCSRRVIRGGSFLGSTAELKASYRSSQSSSKRSNQVGFRVARDVKPEELAEEKR